MRRKKRAPSPAISKACSGAATSSRQMAILVRASFQMREFEDRFLMLGIPYRVIGGPRFYERAEIRDAHGLFARDRAGRRRFGLRAHRQQAEARHRRGQHPGVAGSRAQNRRAAAGGGAQKLPKPKRSPPKARKTLGDFAKIVARWHQQSKQIPHPQLAEIVLDESGYTDMLKGDKSPEAPGRLENLKELVRSMEQYESLAAFLEHVSLVMELEQGGDAGDRVNLMTLHAAKGLEFETVFLPGWEEGLFPSQRTMDEKGTEGLEEERRLAYVGLTRAKSRARISFAANRRIHGSWQSGVPSRFVGELPEAHVEMIADEGMYGGYGGFRDNSGGNFGSTYDSPGWRRAQAARGANPFGGGQAGGFSESPASKYGGGHGRMSARLIDVQAKVVKSDTASLYKAGERVFHQKFGYGRIMSVDGNKLEVEFDKAGTKRVIDNFVQRA